MLKKIICPLLVVSMLTVLCACFETKQSDGESDIINSTISNEEINLNSNEISDISDEENTINVDKFFNDRATFKTNLFYKGPAPQDYDEDATLPTGVLEITYQSGDLELKAWISKAPTDGKIHPAIVYIHGGFAFGEGDWDDAKPYLDAGYVVMTPMLRGENGNPGNYELFYGEVDDAIAAGNYLKTLSYVDPDRIFLSGHSTGGTISMLASMLPSPYKAIATFGASPDQNSFFEAYADIVPFYMNRKDEISIRSPLSNVISIQKPLFVYTGKEDFYYKNSMILVNQAKGYGKDCEFIQMDGDHFSSLAPSIEDSIVRFNNMP